MTPRCVFRRPPFTAPLPSSRPWAPQVDASVFACLCLFSVEIAVLSFAQAGYFLNTFFWLDLIATLSLIFDITWLYSAEVSPQTDLTVARASRAARVGSRAGRIARVLRVARLVRVLRLLRIGSTIQRTANPLGTSFRVRVPRQLSERGSELISRRVVVLVLAVLIAVSFLQVVEVDVSAQAALEQVLAFNATVVTTASIAAQQPAYVAAFDAAVSQYQETVRASPGEGEGAGVPSTSSFSLIFPTRTPTPPMMSQFADELLRLKVFGVEYPGSHRPEVLEERRSVELQRLVGSDTDTTAVLDERDSEVARSWFSLATIGCIVAILLAGAPPTSAAPRFHLPRGR